MASFKMFDQTICHLPKRRGRKLYLPIKYKLIFLPFIVSKGLFLGRYLCTLERKHINIYGKQEH